MSQNREHTQADFAEDDGILAQLSDPIDVEAFTNLMENAHREGVSAADFIREEPKRTSRRAIRKLCLKDRKRSLKAMVRAVTNSLWDRPAEDPAGAFVSALFTPQPPRSPGHPGTSRRDSSAEGRS